MKWTRPLPEFSPELAPESRLKRKPRLIDAGETDPGAETMTRDEYLRAASLPCGFCLRGLHDRCDGTVTTATFSDGYRTDPCGCPDLPRPVTSTPPAPDGTPTP